MQRHRTSPLQSWRTFLANHASQIMAADFFVVPTLTFRLLFVLVVLAPDRRRIVHFGCARRSERWKIDATSRSLPGSSWWNR
jgi:hypothetical protein